MPFAFKEGKVYKQDFTLEELKKVQEEAKLYELIYEETSKSWMSDEESVSVYPVEITTDMLLVKDGHFYGCVINCTRSYWGYRENSNSKLFSEITLDSTSPLAVEITDHDTQNGETYCYIYATLRKKA